MNLFSIRPAREEESDKVLSFIKKIADYERLSHEVINSEELLHENVFRKKYAEVYFLQENQHVFGFVLFFFTYSTFTGKPTLYIEDLFIDEPFRGKGYGRETFNHMAKLAIERGCARMEWIVLDWNEQALRLYRAIGAEGLEEWTVQRLCGQALENMAAKAS